MVSMYFISCLSFQFCDLSLHVLFVLPACLLVLFMLLIMLKSSYFYIGKALSLFLCDFCSYTANFECPLTMKDGLRIYIYFILGFDHLIFLLGLLLNSLLVLFILTALSRISRIVLLNSRADGMLCFSSF